MNILISEVAEMFKLLESSYNKKNKCGFLLFNYKSIKMTDLLSKIGVNDFFAIIEETDGSVDYSSSLHYIVQNDKMPLIYKVTSAEHRELEELIANDKQADILIIEANLYSKEIILKSCRDIEKAIMNCKVSDYIININKSESEISLLLKEIEKEKFEKFKEIL